METMDKVVDTIQKNLPSQMSFGPVSMGGALGNDMQGQPQSEYNMMEDEQVAMATAAAAAARAMQHEQEQQSAFGYTLGNQPRYQSRQQPPRQSQPYQQRYPQPPQQVRQVLQGIRERTPEVLQGIRERTPEYWQSMKERAQKHTERTPEYWETVKQTVKQHGDTMQAQAPEYLHKVAARVQQVLRPGEFGGQPEYDCDAAGRRIVAVSDGQYSSSLNEGDERREQPPAFAFPDGHRIRERAHQVCNKMRAMQGLKPLSPPASRAHTNSTTSNSGAEYYVNFHDGDAHVAIEGALASNSDSTRNSSYIRPQLPEQSADSGYADMDDGAAATHVPPVHPTSDTTPSQAAVERSSSQQQQPRSSSFLQSQPRSSSSLQQQPSSPSSPHSTTHFHWGAASIHKAQSSQIVEIDEVKPDLLDDEQAPMSCEEKKQPEDGETQSHSTSDTEDDTDDLPEEEEEDTASHEDDEDEKEVAPPMAMHSTAKFTWGAPTTTNSTSTSANDHHGSQTLTA